MKLYIYIGLFILLIVYINTHNNLLCNKETFVSTVNSEIKTTQTNQIDTNSSSVHGFDSNANNIYEAKYWTIKPNGFSDIYNYEDTGSLKVYNKVNYLNSNDNKPKSDVVVAENSNKSIKYEGNDFKFIGAAINKYYKQYYWLYEGDIKPTMSNMTIEEDMESMKNNQVFTYILVKVHNDQPVVVHWVGPRNKINVGEDVYFALGSFQLGPLTIKPY
jgi:hypothetical protein